MVVGIGCWVCVLLVCYCDFRGASTVSGFGLGLRLFVGVAVGLGGLFAVFLGRLLLFVFLDW